MTRKVHDPQKRFHALRWAQWVIIPLLVFTLAEAGVRLRPRAFWYREHAEVLATNNLGRMIVFVGSSRTGGGIDSVLAGEIANEHGLNVDWSWNAASGYTTLIQHCYGVRRLIASLGDRSNGLILMVEAVGGLPDHESLQSGQWIYPSAPERIARVADFTDISDVWRSHLTTDEKLSMTMEIAGRPWYTFHGRTRIWARLNNLLTAGLPQRLTDAPEDESDHVDLDRAAGIRVDAEGVEMISQINRENALARVKNQEPMIYDEHSVFLELVRMVNDAGGQVVVFDAPISSYSKIETNTVMRQNDRKRLDALYKKMNIIHLTPDFIYSDDDLPDLLHLSVSRREDFTRSLMLDLIEKTEANSPSAK